MRLQGRGAVSTCVTTPIILPPPTYPWALHLPALLPHGTTWASTWTRVAHARCLPHLCATCAPFERRVGLAALPRGLACRVASVQVSRARSASCAMSALQSCGFKPPFFAFLSKEFNKNQMKHRVKIQKTSKIHNSRNRTPFNLKFSPLDHKFLHFSYHVI